jgi:hypothetical protein
MAKGEHFFLRGNHDNPAVCRRQKFWVRDGTYAFDDLVFCVGGTESYDKQWRTEGYDWWANEELTYKELDMMLQLYDQARPQIVATHDAPQLLLQHLYRNQMLHTDARGCGQRTRAALDAMFEIHRPKLWVHGHWHLDWDVNILGTRFVGLGELKTLTIDPENL